MSLNGLRPEWAPVAVVSRYYFHIKEGATVICDPEGDELPDEGAALCSVKEIVNDILTRPDAYGGFPRWAGREFVVTNERGDMVLTIPVAALVRPN
jgi:hypothetical protein